MSKLTPEKAAELKARIARAIEDANPEYLIGADEVGFGPVAGPLVIGVVGVPRAWVPPVGINDSKNLTRLQVTKLAADFYRMMAADPTRILALLIYTQAKDIDRLGLGRSRRESLINGIAIVRERYPADARTLAVVDGNLNLPDSVSVPSADALCPVVSMAAIIAKHSRDEWMVQAAKEHPGYGFEDHVGYDTDRHRAALRAKGPCPLHRMSTSTLRDKKYAAV